LERIAGLLDTQLDDPGRATQAFEQLLELEPAHPTALSALTRLYGEAKQHAKLLSVLRAQAMYSEDPAEKASLLLRIGQVLEEQLGQSEQALAHYREALETWTSREIYEQLGRLLNSMQRWDALLGLFQEQLAGSQSVEERIALNFRIGRLYEQQLEQPEEAAEAYKRALEIDAGYWPALRGIVRVGIPELKRVGLEEMLLPKTEEGAEDTTALLRIALTLLGQQPENTLELLKRVIEQEPG
jgi:tetratricopeptide (TPR) repeat protein